MSVFDKFTSKVSDTAKAAARKSGELVEVTKLNAAINQESEKIEKGYKAIGKIIFEKYTNGNKFTDDIKAICDEIDEINSSIQGMRDRVNDLKNIILCKNCGNELEEETIYCPKCGVKVEREEKPAEDKKE
jgi:hypothetical protein